jgi:hypothetical protein
MARSPGRATPLVLALALAAALGAPAILGGCPIIDVGDTPVAPPDCQPSLADFKKPGGIWDVAIDPPDQSKSCVAQVACHNQATGRSALKLIVKPRSAMLDNEWSFNYDSVTRFLNCSTPADSQFITKPEAGTDPHLGGDIWTCDSQSCEPERTIEAWIAAH